MCIFKSPSLRLILFFKMNIKSSEFVKPMLFEQESDGRVNHSIENDADCKNSTDQSYNFDKKLMPLSILRELKDSDGISFISK